MEVKVHMVAFSEHDSIRTVTLPEEHTVGKSSQDLLDLVFHYGQNDFSPSDEHYSVSVGDVIELEGFYLVLSIGFKKISEGEFEEYLKTPFQQRVLKAYGIIGNDNPTEN
jgi:hypothetical protein